MTEEQISDVRIDRLEEVIRELIAFAKHGPRCVFPAGTFLADGGPAAICRCGLQKVFDRVDELVKG